MFKDEYKKMSGDFFLGRTIGEIGITDNDLLIMFSEQSIEKILNDKESFESFVEVNYKTFQWDTYELKEEQKKALFARLLINISKHFYNSVNGYKVNDGIFNGIIYIPRKIIGNEIVLLKSNYFSRMSFMKSKDSLNSKLLSKYNDDLESFDNHINDKLKCFFSKGSFSPSDFNTLLDNLAITSHTVSVMVETNDGYLYTIRGKESMGSGKATLITGIVDRKNLLELVKIELLEELGIDKGIKSILSKGASLVSQNLESGTFVVINFKYLATVDLSSDEISELFETAVDSYENSHIYTANVNYKDLTHYFEKIPNKSVILEAFLSE